MANKCKINVLTNIVHLLTIALIIWSMTPYLRRNVPLSLSAIILTIWVMVVLVSILNNKIKFPKHFIYLFLYLGLIFIYRFIGLSTAAWGNYFNLLVFFFFTWAYYYYMKYASYKKRVQLVIIGIAISVVNVISNIYLLYMFPNASVELNYSKLFYNSNVGGTAFSFFTLILLIFFLIIRDNLKGKQLNLLNTLVVVASIVYIIQASRATSVFLMLFSILLFIYSKFVINKSALERALFTTFFILLSFLLLLNLNNILIILSNYIENERLEIRINAIISVLSGGGTEEGASLVSRVQLYKLSITTFFSSIKSFVFGVGYHTTESLSISWLFNVGVGNHSELLDTAARYGLIGLLPLGMFFHSFFRYIKRNIISKDSKKLNIILLVFLIYSILNNSFDPSVGVLILLIIPLFFANKNRAILEGIREEETINATK